MVTNEERLTEMEQRVADLEAELRARQRSRVPVGSVLRELVPPEVRSHVRAARKEQLLAMRAYLDRAIGRLNREEGDSTTDSL